MDWQKRMVFLKIAESHMEKDVIMMDPLMLNVNIEQKISTSSITHIYLKMKSLIGNPAMICFFVI